MELLPEPLSRSPSQCPGTARSSTEAGRSRIDTMSGISPRVSALADVREDRGRTLAEDTADRLEPFAPAPSVPDLGTLRPRKETPLPSLSHHTPPPSQR